MDKKKKKRKLNTKRFFTFLFIVFLIGLTIYYFCNIPIKNIKIEGNYYLKDNYIANYLDLKDAKILTVSRRNIKNKLLKIDLISDVKISKNYFGTLKLKITEDKILFYNWNNKKMVLASGREIPYNKEYLGVPTLINYVPDDIYKEFIKKLNKIDKEVLSLVSEIEYSRSMINDKVIDDKRFLFRMNDGNQVYINTINIEKFNDYLEIYDAIENKNGDTKGCLYLDSNSENNHFNNCEEDKIVNPEDGENPEDKKDENNED